MALVHVVGKVVCEELETLPWVGKQASSLCSMQSMDAVTSSKLQHIWVEGGKNVRRVLKAKFCFQWLLKYIICICEDCWHQTIVLTLTTDLEKLLFIYIL